MSQFRKDTLAKYFQKSMKGTIPKQGIHRKEILIGRVRVENGNFNVYITSWSLKHIYEKREEFCEFFVIHSYAIINHSDSTYVNKGDRDNEYLLVKEFSEYLVCAVLKVSKNKMFVITSFGIKENYLKKMKKIK